MTDSQETPLTEPADHVLLEGRQVAADPEGAVQKMVSIFQGYQEYVATVRAETGAAPEPSGYNRHRTAVSRTNQLRRDLEAAGVDPAEARERGWPTIQAELDEELRERAVDRLHKVSELAAGAETAAAAVRTQLTDGTRTTDILPAIDALIATHRRITDILILNREALDGTAQSRRPGT